MIHCSDKEHISEDEFETIEERVTFQLDEEVTEHVKLRSTYQWMPTEFVIDQNGHVTITTAIPQLEKISEKEQLYKDIAEVFEAMLPAFQKIEIVGRSAKPGHTLQVIVKAQSYNLKAGMKYAGRWHTEEGGALKFRPKRAPQKNGLRGTFLNFFIVDPRKPIDLNSYSSYVLAPLDIIIPILDQASDGRLIIGPILDKIIEHLGSSVWKNIEDAKEFRAKVRKAMMNEESGWGWIQRGNCSFVGFVKARCLYKDKDE